MEKRILLVEDDPDIRLLVGDNVRSLGYELTIAEDGEKGCELALGSEFRLIILDVNLPGIDGIEVCQRVREVKQDVPILMLTARAGEIDRVRGLELGADDYLTKPFSVNELKARIKALLRRVERHLVVAPEKAEPEKTKVQMAELEIDPVMRRCTLEGEPVALTAREFDLLFYLASNPGVPFTRAHLLAEVWYLDHDEYEVNVNAHINRLRGKIEKDQSQRRFIKTVRGVGYRFAEEKELK